MDEPQDSLYQAPSKLATKPEMPIEEMWKIARKANTVWGIEGYEAPRLYEDPIRQIQDREYAKMREKPGKNKVKHYVTKRGSFLDNEFRICKERPGAGAYNIATILANPEDKKRKVRPTAKNSYIDQIERTAKLRGVPGVGQYNLFKSDKEIEAELKELKKKPVPKKDGPKDNFLNDYEYLSDTIPGPGNFNPRLPQRPVHKERLLPKEYIEKHSALEKKYKKSTFPDIGTYNPMPCYSTFQKTWTTMSSKPKSEKPKTTFFGTETRFKDITKTKSTFIVNGPGPANYDTIAYWQGKEEGNKKRDSDKAKKNWHDSVSTGPYTSLYYESDA